MKKQLLLLATYIIMITACGNEAQMKELPFEVLEPKSCQQEDRNRFIYDVLKDSYLWSDKVGDINISLDVDDVTFLDNFLYKKRDKFSFILSKKLFEAQFENGTAKDLGFLTTQIEREVGVFETVVAFVYPNSPAAKAGLKRSDKILSVKESYFHIKRQDGEEDTIMIEEASYDVDNVLYATTYSVNQKKVGYFLLQSFIGPHIIFELNQIFADFKAQGISELVVDLRYNGGGILDIAAHLGTLIGGEKVAGHILQYNRYNKKYSHYNSSTYFVDLLPSSLNIDRVLFLTTKNSASASESIINGLRAKENAMEVVTIGTNTYGKPYGMHTIAYCDKVLVPIHFADENSDGVGGFIDGLEPTCYVQEAFKHDFQERNETLLAEALYYIAHGACSE
jgi:C-terminal processing protease CtpA/Prc